MSDQLNELKREDVKNCPCCGSTIRSKALYDWNKIKYVFCADCKSSYQDPRIIYEYEENYWGEITDPDGNIRNLASERDFKIKNWYGDSVNFVNSIKPKRILDVGAGIGFFLSAIDSCEKHAVEISEYACKIIKERYKDINVFNGDLKNSTFKKNYFDVIMFYHVIEHLEKPDDILDHLYKLLRKDGILIVGTPNISSIAAKVFQSNFRLFGPGHLCLFNPKSLEKILSNHRFRIIKKEYPFWKTDYANFSNIIRMFMPWKISPAFYGSIMTFYAKKT